MPSLPYDKPALMAGLPCWGMERGWNDSWAVLTTYTQREGLEKYLRKCVREPYKGYVHVYQQRERANPIWTLVRGPKPDVVHPYGRWITTYNLMDLPLWAVLLSMMDQTLDAKPARDIAVVL